MFISEVVKMGRIDFDGALPSIVLFTRQTIVTYASQNIVRNYVERLENFLDENFRAIGTRGPTVHERFSSRNCIVIIMLTNDEEVKRNPGVCYGHYVYDIYGIYDI